jgi:hypothetical protein
VLRHHFNEAARRTDARCSREQDGIVTMSHEAVMGLDHRAILAHDAARPMVAWDQVTE